MLENVSNSGVPIFILQSQTSSASRGQCQVQAGLPACGLPLHHVQHTGAVQKPSCQCWRRATRVASLSLCLQTGFLPVWWESKVEEKDVGARGKTCPHGDQNAVRTFLRPATECDDRMFAPVRWFLVINKEHLSYFCPWFGWYSAFVFNFIEV